MFQKNQSRVLSSGTSSDWDDLMEQYYEAFTEPSMEHGGTYMQLAFVLVFFAAIIWVCCQARGADGSAVISADDLGHEFKGSGAEDEKDRPVKSKGGKRTRKGKDDVQSTGRDENTTTAGHDEMAQAEYRHMSLKKEYDRKGPF